MFVYLLYYNTFHIILLNTATRCCNDKSMLYLIALLFHFSVKLIKGDYLYAD